MANIFTMRLTAKGREDDLTALKGEILKHCNPMAPPPATVAEAEYWVDLARWNPKREDWVRQPLGWWLELRKGRAELLPAKDGELRASAVGRWGAPLHFLDGLRELYPDLELSAYTIDLCNKYGEDWRCSPEGTFCVEEVMSCWEAQPVWHWMKDGRLMIDDGKPVAEELLEFAGTEFVMVNGVPQSLAVQSARDYVRGEVQRGRKYLTSMLKDKLLWEGLNGLDGGNTGSGHTGQSKEESPAREGFFAELKRKRQTQEERKATE